MSALTFAPEGHGLMRCSEDRKQEDRKTKQQPVGMYSVILLRRDTHDLTKENKKTGMEYEKHVTEGGKKKVTTSHQNTQKLTEVCIFIPSFIHFITKIQFTSEALSMSDMVT